MNIPTEVKYKPVVRYEHVPEADDAAMRAAEEAEHKWDRLIHTGGSLVVIDTTKAIPASPTAEHRNVVLTPPLQEAI